MPDRTPLGTAMRRPEGEGPRVADAAAAIDAALQIGEEFRTASRIERRPARGRTPLEHGADPVDRLRRDRTVAVVGLGRHGLRTALALVETGHEVVGFDMCRDRLATVAGARGALDDADQLRLRNALVSPGLVLTNEARTVAGADAVLICTPMWLDDHRSPDIKPLANACADVVRLARPGQMIMLTSPAYAGATADLLVRPLEEWGYAVGRDVNVAFSAEAAAPHRLGAWGPPARVLGGATEGCALRAEALVARLTPGVRRLASTGAAELAALLQHAMCAVGDALADEIAGVCDALGVDVGEIVDPRPSGAEPAAAVPGGIEPRARVWQMRRHRVRMPLVESALNRLEERAAAVARTVELALASSGVAASHARVLAVGVADRREGADGGVPTSMGDVLDHLSALGIEVETADVPCPSHETGRIDAAPFDLVLVPADGDARLVLDGARRILEISGDLSCREVPSGRVAAGTS